MTRFVTNSGFRSTRYGIGVNVRDDDGGCACGNVAEEIGRLTAKIERVVRDRKDAALLRPANTARPVPQVFGSRASFPVRTRKDDPAVRAMTQFHGPRAFIDALKRNAEAREQGGKAAKPAKLAKVKNDAVRAMTEYQGHDAVLRALQARAR